MKQPPLLVLLALPPHHLPAATLVLGYTCLGVTAVAKPSSPLSDVLTHKRATQLQVTRTAVAEGAYALPANSCLRGGRQVLSVNTVICFTRVSSSSQIFAKSLAAVL